MKAERNITLYECPADHVHPGVSKEFEGWFCLTPDCNRRAKAIGEYILTQAVESQSGDSR
jgi:hypothetical protein